MHGPDQQVRTNMRETRSAWKTRLPILIVMWFHYFHRICAYIKRARGVFPMRRVSEMTMPKIPGRGIYQWRRVFLRAGVAAATGMLWAPV